jgi:6-phosphogluconolactonase
MKISTGLLLFLFAVLRLSGAESRFYLGTYTDQPGSKGIYEGSLDSETGKLGPIMLAAAATDPSFLALSPKGDDLYAALEQWNKAGVAAFRRGADGALTPLNSKVMVGAGTCFVSVAPDGSEVFAANYNSGNIAGFAVGAGGELGEQTASVTFAGSGPNKDRQQGPHAHSIYSSPDGRYVYACDLGSDRVWIFRRAGGKLLRSVPAYVHVPPGNGARHLAFGADARFVYVSNEMGHSVTVFSRSTANGGLKMLQSLSVVPANVPTAGVGTAEIVLHPSGKWIYVSNRGCDTISVLEIQKDGKLRLIQSVPALVHGPRSFAIDPGGHWLVTAGQNDNRIAELKIDPGTGLLNPTAESAQVGSPACVLFENAP